MTKYTPAQLEAWAGCTAKYPEPITQDLWNERVALFAEAKLHAPALARLVLEKEKEIAGLRVYEDIALRLLKIMALYPDTLIKGIAAEAFKELKIARQAMKETSDE